MTGWPDQAERAATWWKCPNDPPCPHGAILHDTDGEGSPAAVCCADGCTCGHRIKWGRGVRHDGCPYLAPNDVVSGVWVCDKCGAAGQVAGELDDRHD